MSTALATALTVIAAMATVVAIVLFGRTLAGMVRTYRGGQPTHRSDNPGLRTATLLRETLLASRLKQQPVGAIVATDAGQRGGVRCEEEHPAAVKRRTTRDHHAAERVDVNLDALDEAAGAALAERAKLAAPLAL